MHTDTSVNSSPTTGTSAFDLQAAQHWLELLHGFTFEGQMHICSTADWNGRAFNDAKAAARYAAELSHRGVEGIYVRTTTLQPGYTGRGSVKDSWMLPGFALDIDLAGPGHKTTERLPATIADAQQIITAAGVPEPTLWVHSGGGVYPWWMFDEPVDIRDPEDRELAQYVAQSLQALVKAAATSLGWHFGTGVIDLARVLRLPGSVNRKEGLARPCRIVEPAAYNFHDYNALAGHLLAAASTLVTENTPAEVRRGKPIQVTDDMKPGDAMELAWGWEEILVNHGWRRLRRMGRGWAWQRPGKEGLGLSATTGMAADRDRLFVFTTEAHPLGCSFDVGPITKFGAYTFLEHGGDFKAAASALRKLGFGGSTQQQQRSDLASLVKPKDAGSASTEVEPVRSEQVQVVEQVVPAVAPVSVIHGRTFPEVDLGTEQESIMALSTSINMGHVPDLYVRDGQLVHVQHKSGTRTPEVSVTTVTADRLNHALAHSIRTFKFVKTNGRGDIERKPAAPTLAALRAVVSSDYWPGVPALTGVVGVPTLRPDGTLIQDPGYDKETGLFLHPTSNIKRIPDSITDGQLRASREFVFSKVFGEFCWASAGDFANFMGLLLSPMLRPYIETTTPFGMITATTRGSGKTNLSDAIGMVYGQSSQVWPGRPEELQKKITSILIGNSSPVVVFDNLREGTSISSETIATLVTKDDWDDRLLGASQNVQARNDRLWLATGNGLTVGGDMASRTVMVRLDPRMERPELRQFDMGQFSDWIREPGNRAELTYHLIILVQAWMQAGATKDTSFTMRGFTKWAQTVGGLLAFHGLTGFLSNTDDLAARDTDEEEWATFLAKWHQIFGPSPRTSKELHVSAQVDFVMGTQVDRWGRCFISDEAGHTPTPKVLGMMLAGRRDRIYGGLTLRSTRNNQNATVWWVEKREDGPEQAGVRDMAAGS